MASKHSPQRAHGIEQRRKAMELRRSGLTYDAIATQLGITAPTAYVHVKNALAEARETYKAEAHEHIQLDLERCDAILEALAPTISDPRCADTILRVLERRAKLLGLDAAEKRENVNLELQSRPAEYARTVAEIRGCTLAEASTWLLSQANGTTTTTLPVPTNGVGGKNGDGH